MSRLLLPVFACVLSCTAVSSIAAEPPSNRTEVVSYPRLTPFEEKVRKVFEDRTEVAFTETPLTDVIDFLEDLHQITILVDTAALQDEGVDPSSPVTLEVANVSLRNVTKLVLRPLSLTTIIEDDVLKVTTQSKADETLVTRVYPVHDLAVSAEEVTALISVIQNGVASETWKKPEPAEAAAVLKAVSKTGEGKAVCTTCATGTGSITSMPKSRSLVIRHSQQTHAEIEALLENLRAAEADFNEFARQHMPRTAEAPRF